MRFVRRCSAGNCSADDVGERLSSMKTCEFKASVIDGIIHIPDEYKDVIPNKVTVIILPDEAAEKSNQKYVFDAMSLDTRGFVFDREEANER